MGRIDLLTCKTFAWDVPLHDAVLPAPSLLHVAMLNAWTGQCVTLGLATFVLAPRARPCPTWP
ncbi:hypothetical protein HAX54_040618, partial [Datura stramonium]|nr:hypothetical protein [Datura stramonium]